MLGNVVGDELLGTHEGIIVGGIVIGIVPPPACEHATDGDVIVPVVEVTVIEILGCVS